MPHLAPISTFPQKKRQPPNKHLFSSTLLLSRLLMMTTFSCSSRGRSAEGNERTSKRSAGMVQGEEITSFLPFLVLSFPPSFQRSHGRAIREEGGGEQGAETVFCPWKTPSHVLRWNEENCATQRPKSLLRRVGKAAPNHVQPAPTLQRRSRWAKQSLAATDRTGHGARSLSPSAFQDSKQLRANANIYSAAA